MKPRFKGLFEFPTVFIISGIFSIWLLLDNYYSKAGQVLFSFTVLSFLIWLVFMLGNYKIREINSVKGNTLKAMSFAVIGLLISTFGAILTGIIFKGWNLSSVYSLFIENSKSAVLGASNYSPYANNSFLQTTIFGFGFPINETVILCTFAMLMAISFKVRFNINLKKMADINNIKILAITAVLVTASIVYHIFAKSISTGQPNESALIIIGWIFGVEVLLFFLTKEMEASIWHHIFNNILALGIVYVFGAITSIWIYLVLILILYFIISKSNKGIKFLRKMKIAY